MNAVILCAGFATRMYPLTQHYPKPLLRVADRPVLDYLMDQLDGLPDLEAVYIVSNGRFFDHFSRWETDRATDGPGRKVSVSLLNDKAMANESRLGAIADLQLALKAINHPGRVLVSAGDNIFLFPIQSLWEPFLQSDHHHIVALPETDTQKLQRTGVLELGENDRLVRLHEKPQLPPLGWVCPPLYFFQASVGSAIESFLEMDGNGDAPGHFIDYLCRREPVSAFRLASSRLDIGSIDTYREADRFLRQNPI